MPHLAKKIIQYAAGFLALASLPGCISVQAIEPVISPPSQFQVDATVPVEFVAPVMVGLRCAERGAKFLGLPGLNSGACSDRTLMTFPDPCYTLTAGWYADVLCREISEVRGLNQPARLEAPSTLAMDAANRPDGAPAGLLAAAWRSDAPPGLVAISDAARPRPSSSRPAAKARRAAPSFLPETTQPLRVEFVAADQVMVRCAERGAKFVSGSQAGACADARLLTIANPCSTPKTGWYGDTLCHEMAHANGWPADHSGGSYLRRIPPIQMASASPEARAYAARTQAEAARPATSPEIAILADLPVAAAMEEGRDRARLLHDLIAELPLLLAADVVTDAVDEASQEPMLVDWTLPATPEDAASEPALLQLVVAAEASPAELAIRPRLSAEDFGSGAAAVSAGSIAAAANGR